MVDMAAFESDLASDLRSGREAFNARYARELDELMGLSREEIDKITPGATDLQEYDRLIAVVKQASRHNLEQAELVSRIRQMGEVAVAIAKKTTALGALLA